jgi:diaminopimelate decarboxylase
MQLLLPITSKINNENHLEVGGLDVINLANKYKTPLYLIDVNTVKHQCREYKESFKDANFETEIIYASKAFNCIAMCQLIDKEGLSIDVSTGGELFIVLKSGYDPSKVYFHGNNKSLEEIKYGIKNKVGCFIVDNFEELNNLDKIAGKFGVKQEIMIRVTPGIHASTHEYIQTGKEKSKFGFNISSGIAMEAVKLALSKKNLKLIGIHSHIGSQIFNVEPYEKLVGIQLKFISDVEKQTSYEIETINIGGGLGVKYVAQDNPTSIKDFAQLIISSVNNYSLKNKVKIKKLMLEPGRSIIGNAGISVYKVGTIKKIPNVHNYISVDGGMSDNIRPILYGAKYSAFIANKMNLMGLRAEDKEKGNDDISNWTDNTFKDKPIYKMGLEKYTIVGKHCESGDILIEDELLPEVAVNDYIVLATTGAYCYSMSSNYNGQPRPAVVAIKDGLDQVWIERESYRDLIKNHKELVLDN